MAVDLQRHSRTKGQHIGKRALVIQFHSEQPDEYFASGGISYPLILLNKAHLSTDSLSNFDDEINDNIFAGD